jgi:hypothetical protein
MLCTIKVKQRNDACILNLVRMMINLFDRLTDIRMEKSRNDNSGKGTKWSDKPRIGTFNVIGPELFHCKEKERELGCEIIIFSFSRNFKILYL